MIKRVILKIWLAIPASVLAVIIAIAFILTPIQLDKPKSKYIGFKIGTSEAAIKKQGNFQGQKTSPTVATNPTSSTSGSWTNGINAYSDDSSYASVTSGSPSSTQTYSGYGFAATGTINQVRVMADAWCVGGSVTQNKNPTATTNGTLPWTTGSNGYESNNSYATVSPTYGATTSQKPSASAAGLGAQFTNPGNAYDAGSNQYATAGTAITTANNYPTETDNNTGGFTDSGGGTTNLWNLVDDTSNTDYVIGKTNGGGRLTFTFTAFSIPANSKNISLSIVYSENGGGTSAEHAASLKVGGTYYDRLGYGATSNGFQEKTYTATTNPKSSAAWTAEQINGTDGTNQLQAFGVSSTDFNPDVQFGYCYAKVTYTYNDEVYTTFGISDPGTSSTITKVEIGYEAFATAIQKLNIYTSADGGTNWSAAHDTGNLSTSDPGSYTYIDVTSDQTWTWTLLNNTNFKIKIETVWINGTPTWSVDNLICRVTYDDRRPYDQIYGTFGIGTTLGTETITKVEVGYEAFASATGKLDLYTSTNGGTNWNTIHTTANLGISDPNTYTYIDVTSDNASWTWTLLNNTNFKLKIVTNYVSGTPAWSVDALIIRITYTAASNDKLELDVSWDGGTSWSSSKHQQVLTGSETTYWIDVSSDTAWDGTKLNDTNFRVRVDGLTVGDDPSEVRLDYLPVEVTYTPGLGITNSPISYDFGIVEINQTYNTGLEYFTVTNTSVVDIDITINGTDLTGGSTWTLADNATPGNNIMGFKAGLSPPRFSLGFGGTEDVNATLGFSGGDNGSITGYINQGDYSCIVKKNTTYNKLIYKMPGGAVYNWGLQLITPTDVDDAVQKSGTITLVASAS